MLAPEIRQKMNENTRCLPCGRHRVFLLFESHSYIKNAKRGVLYITQEEHVRKIFRAIKKSREVITC